MREIAGSNHATDIDFFFFFFFCLLFFFLGRLVGKELMSAFEKTRYILDQSIWECNGHFDHWFSNIKDFLCGV